MTKTKQMLREKYWFPAMNYMVEEMIKQCFECQVTTKQQRQEPMKMTEIPEYPWEVVSVDFGGSYPDGHYNLVVIDNRTRYSEVENLHTTACKQTKEKLKKIFATHGIPRRLESDNGLPFNSIDFANFAIEEGFEHHKITPLHPRANGAAEAFMKVLNKTEQIANLQNKDSATAIQEMLIGYRSTPHPATGISPDEALMKRQVRTKLGYIQRKHNDREITEEKEINERQMLQGENQTQS
jgi:transposase InsO family protein